MSEIHICRKEEGISVRGRVVESRKKISVGKKNQKKGHKEYLPERISEWHKNLRTKIHGKNTNGKTYGIFIQLNELSTLYGLWVDS